MLFQHVLLMEPSSFELGHLRCPVEYDLSLWVDHEAWCMTGATTRIPKQDLEHMYKACTLYSVDLIDFPTPL